MLCKVRRSKGKDPKSKISFFCRLPGITVTRSQAERGFDLAQVSYHSQRFFRVRGRAVDGIFTISHQRFKLLSTESRSGGHTRSDFGTRAVVVQAGMT
ncbi:MAG TPA: hypothetical protein VF333_06100, partial [Pyrinomonadaceae bacterium]